MTVWKWTNAPNVLLPTILSGKASGPEIAPESSRSSFYIIGFPLQHCFVLYHDWRGEYDPRTDPRMDPGFDPHLWPPRYDARYDTIRGWVLDMPHRTWQERALQLISILFCSPIPSSSHKQRLCTVLCTCQGHDDFDFFLYPASKKKATKKKYWHIFRQKLLCFRLPRKDFFSRPRFMFGFFIIETGWCGKPNGTLSDDGRTWKSSNNGNRFESGLFLIFLIYFLSQFLWTR